MSYSIDRPISIDSRRFSGFAWIAVLLPALLLLILSVVYESKFTKALYNPEIDAEPIWNTLFLIFFILAGVFMFIIGLLGVFTDSWILFLLPPIFYVVTGLVHNIKYTTALNSANLFVILNCDTLCIVFLAFLGVYLVTTGLVGGIRSQRRSIHIQGD